MKKISVLFLIQLVLYSCINPPSLNINASQKSPEYNYVQLDSYENFSILMLGEMDDFLELIEKYETEVIFVRTYTTVMGGESTEFAFPYDGTLIVVKGNGYRRLFDYQDAASKDILNAVEYYERKSRGFPYIRNFSYFID